MSERIRSLLFAGLLSLVCSVLLTAASTGLQDLQQHNMRLEKKRNILKAVGLIETGKIISESDIERIYDQNIRTFWVTPAGDLVDALKRNEADLALYVRLEDQKIRNYAVPVESRGLWGKIYAYLALESDGATIAGFTVFKHAETPGLGGEIEKEWFQKKWIGKKIIDKKGAFVSVSIARGAAKDAVSDERLSHYVDGISGATLTGRYLSAGIRQTLESYEPVSIRFRKHMISSVK
jgi:Na+-transporting NADH:ubiquinone oxidoreductase subunit C